MKSLLSILVLVGVLHGDVKVMGSTKVDYFKVYVLCVDGYKFLVTDKQGDGLDVAQMFRRGSYSTTTYASSPSQPITCEDK